MNTKIALQIAKAINVSDLREDARTILEAFEDAKDSSNFTVDFGKIEYRIIHDNVIERVHRESIEELVDDCYGLERIKQNMGNLAYYLEFDYDSLASDSRMSYGYGHHFASYDGEEIEVENWHIFRTN